MNEASWQYQRTSNQATAANHLERRPSVSCSKVLQEFMKYDWEQERLSPTCFLPQVNGSCMWTKCAGRAKSARYQKNNYCLQLWIADNIINCDPIWKGDSCTRHTWNSFCRLHFIEEIKAAFFIITAFVALTAAWISKESLSMNGSERSAIFKCC